MRYSNDQDDNRVIELRNLQTTSLDCYTDSCKPAESGFTRFRLKRIDAAGAKKRVWFKYITWYKVDAAGGETITQLKTYSAGVDGTSLLINEDPGLDSVPVEI